MYVFLLFICCSISSLSGQDFLSKLPEGILQIDILPGLVIPREPNQNYLNYIAHLIGYIEHTEYPELSKCPELHNERLIKKSQLANAPLISLACVNKALNQHITAYKKLFKKHITEMIPQDCTLQEVLGAYPFIRNYRSFTIYLPDQIDLAWSRVFNWRITRMRDVFSIIFLKSINDNNDYAIQMNIIENYCEGWQRHKKIVHNARSSEKTITEKCTDIINFLDNSIELLKVNNSFPCDGQEEIVNSLRTFFYILNFYNKAIEKIDTDILDIGVCGECIYLKLKKFNSLDNQNEIIPDDRSVMSPTDIYKLYKAMLGLF